MATFKHWYVISMVFTGWAEPFLKVHLAEVALDASNILSEQGKASDAQDLLEGCTKSSLEYMRDLYDRYGFRESVFDSMKEIELVPDLYRECSYRLTVLHINKGGIRFGGCYHRSIEEKLW